MKRALKSAATTAILLFLNATNSQALNETKPLVITSDKKIDDSAGTVAIAEGTVFAQKAKIFYTRVAVGEVIQVNPFGQYKDTKPAPVFVKWVAGTRRLLKANDTVHAGEVIQTAGSSFAKILFKDDSLIDIGPSSAIQIEKYVFKKNQREVVLKLAYGRVRSIVAQQLKQGQSYQVLTPMTTMQVRGTEFLVNVTSDKESRSKTELVCIHGQVSLDVARNNNKGLVYYQPIVINPGSSFTTSGWRGIGQEVQATALRQIALRDAVKEASPQVNAYATFVGAQPTNRHLPGTGVASSTSDGCSTRECIRPRQYRELASSSDNFIMPSDLGHVEDSFGDLVDISRFTGPPPTDQVPL